ncbi:MAG: hypothetical protein II077_11855, partial [Treponema sp.]|nr:hypothetical protein [Treponema sp.]
NFIQGLARFFISGAYFYSYCPFGGQSYYGLCGAVSSKPSSAKGSRSEASSGARHHLGKIIVQVFEKNLRGKNCTDAIFTTNPG